MKKQKIMKKNILILIIVIILALVVFFVLRSGVEATTIPLPSESEESIAEVPVVSGKTSIGIETCPLQIGSRSIQRRDPIG